MRESDFNLRALLSVLPCPTASSWRNVYENQISALHSALPNNLWGWTCRGAAAGQSRKDPCRPLCATFLLSGSPPSRASDRGLGAAKRTETGAWSECEAWLAREDLQEKARLMQCANTLSALRLSVIQLHTNIWSISRKHMILTVDGQKIAPPKRTCDTKKNIQLATPNLPPSQQLILKGDSAMRWARTSTNKKKCHTSQH